MTGVGIVLVKPLWLSVVTGLAGVLDVPGVGDRVAGNDSDDE